MTQTDLAAHARSILDTNRYLTLGTADLDGHPWTSPVYFTATAESPHGWEFYWTSTIDARHSRNLAVRPQVSLVVFDSTVAPYHGRAVYAVGEARESSGDELDHGLHMYPGPSQRGGAPVSHDDVTGASPYRLYRAMAAELWVLCPREPRQPCPLHGIAADHRTRV
jgi:nitroimidazol reductase NimA-like FMN-containing flavoprotein (pyridoxamine 5'-phosphate oxidase superfamily)